MRHSIDENQHRVELEMIQREKVLEEKVQARINAQNERMAAEEDFRR